jgi:signal transduction histidine kinase
MSMSSRSIRFRLVSTALIAILGSMTIAVYALTVLFEHHVERRVVAALEADMRQLMAGLTVAESASVSLQRRPADPRYDQPLSGVYWQVTIGTAVLERSRSLWDETLALPADDPTKGLHEHVIPGPKGRPLVAVERAIRIDRSEKPVTVRFVVAQDRADTIAAIASFNREIMLMLLVLGTLLLLAFGISVSVGLQPLTRLRNDLADLHHGGIRRLGGQYPAEVALLVSDLNKLLDARDRVAERNRRRAADLAHGLKTPITAISTIAEELRDAGQSDIGKELTDYAAIMQRHVERELALARSVHGTHSVAPTPVQPLVAAIVRSLERLPRGQEIEWTIEIPARLAVPVDPTALAEVIGGLLDNARKWARGRVSIRSTETDGRVHLSVTDDGPGVAPEKLTSLASRGVRLDQKQPGSGLGLAIASEIMSELGGSISFSNTPAGGFVASIALPVANGAGIATAGIQPPFRS